MSSTNDFTKFVPGFDFLQSLAKSTTNNNPLGNWIAPTLNVEDLEKRISELKTVNFWLEQNSRALSATIQALEVQKMTLSTLKNMNLNIGDMAKTFQAKASEAAETVQSGMQQATEHVTAAATSATSAAPVVDPLQLWSALAGQFQQIASTAFQAPAASDEATNPEAAPQPKATRTTARKKAGT